MSDAPFDAEDFATASAVAIAAWEAGVHGDWSVPAGTLEWSCWTTADHTVDCVFSYALFLGSRREDEYPEFDVLRAFPHATPADLVDGLRAVTNILYGTIVTAGPDVRAIIRRRPEPATGAPVDFAPRGAHEMLLHTYDICTGLHLPFEPPAGLCERLRDDSARWPMFRTFERSDDPWSDLLERAGRPRARPRSG